MSIYEDFLQRLKLTDSHREALHKRGFTDEVIDEYRFKSAGNYIKDIIKDLSKTYKQEIVSSGLLQRKGVKYIVPSQLLDDRIIIPYLDENRKCYYIRPHKLGLTGIPVEIYQRYNVRGDALVITEGEFKAVASMIYGVPAVALQGIASFSGKHYKRLIDFLKGYNIKRIIILFDNEIKDDPKYPNYKEDPNVRWDTQFYAYFMAKMLSKEFDTLVATLPIEWAVNGKIDIDGMLALGKTKDDYENILNNAVSHTEFLKSLPDEAKLVILRKNKLRSLQRKVRKEYGRYVSIRNDDTKKIISNFTIDIISTRISERGIVREIQLVDEFGQRSKPILLTSDDMVKSDNFASFCMNQGNFIWRGTKEDLSAIWEELFLRTDVRKIYEKDHIGYIQEYNLWMFENLAIKDGKVIKDKDGIYWIDQKGLTYSVLSDQTIIPRITEEKFDIQEFYNRLADTIGNEEAKFLLGWCIAVFYMPELFKKYNMFPFLFICGKRKSGKSTIADWIMSLFGMNNSQYQIIDTTTVAIQRLLSYYSCLPIFLDEYRNLKDIEQRKNPFFRNVYNRQGAAKGIRKDFGIREAKIRGTLLLAGEELPNDSALLSRCIYIFIKLTNRRQNHYRWFMDNRDKFSYFTYWVLTNKDVGKYFDNFTKAYKFLLTTSDNRTALNTATALAGWITMFGRDNNILEYASNLSLEYQKQHEIQHIVQVFFEDLVTMFTSTELKANDYILASAKYYFIYYNALYSEWMKWKRQQGINITFTKESIQHYIREMEGYSGDDRRVINGNRVSVIRFNIKCDPLIVELFEATSI